MLFLQLLTKILIATFVVSCMFAVGLSLTLPSIIAPLRNIRLLVLACAANFVVVPLIAFGLTVVLPLSPHHCVGLILLAVAAGAPFLPKLVELAKSDLPYSVALMILQTVGTVLFMPIALPLMVPGLHASAWSIIEPLLVLLLLPLALGLALHWRWERLCMKLRPWVGGVSNISLLLALGLIIGLNARALWDVITVAALSATAFFIVGSFLAGYALGGPNRDMRSVLGLGTAQRNIAAALVTATASNQDPAVVAMLLMATLLGLVLLLIIIAMLRFRRGRIPVGASGTS
ncbi:MAG: bile acid:sodium symporter family protein [Planctomycetes bacterium]|nr:bile acid:sodium symporter family protein [Planctomycetota bacterium]